MAQCPVCGAPVPGAENHACDNCRQASYTAYTDAQGRTVFSSQVPQPRPPARGLRIADAPVTWTLIAANSVVFLLMVLSGIPIRGFPETKEGFEALLRWGAESGRYVLLGQYWRMFTAIFLHDGIIHIGMNMWSLWQLGLLTERLLGRNAYLWLYMLSGLAGSIASVAVDPQVLTVGASGAIFGIAGGLIAILMFVRLNAPPARVAALRNNLIFVVIINLAVLSQFARINNMAHVGGVVAGFLIALALSRGMNISPEAYRRAQAWVFPLAVVILVAAFIAVRNWRLGWLQQHLSR